MMKKTLSLIVAVATIMNISCTPYKIITHSTLVKLPYEDRLKGKSIGIIPFDISFGAFRFVIDLRDIKISVGGEPIVLQDRFITKDNDSRLGEVGLLDVDILTKAKVDKTVIQQAITNFLISALDGQQDYHVAFFNGLGEDNMGELSNRPIEYDRTTFPPAIVFKSLDTPSVVYSETRVLPLETEISEAGTDFVLTGDISISSEILEVIAPPPDAENDIINASTHVPKPGDYYLSVFGSMRFKLVDTKTGEVIVSEKTKRDHSIKDYLGEHILIDAVKGDAAAYAKYFRTFDFSSATIKAVNEILPSMLPLLSSFYVNTSHRVSLKE